MMEMLQRWLLGLTAAALAVSLLTAMVPKETIRRIAGLAGGLILLLAVGAATARVQWELTWRYETYQREPWTGRRRRIRRPMPIACPGT